MLVVVGSSPTDIHFKMFEKWKNVFVWVQDLMMYHKRKGMLAVCILVRVRKMLTHVFILKMSLTFADNHDRKRDVYQIRLIVSKQGVRHVTLEKTVLQAATFMLRQRKDTFINHYGIGGRVHSHRARSHSTKI